MELYLVQKNYSVEDYLVENYPEKDNLVKGVRQGWVQVHETEAKTKSKYVYFFSTSTVLCYVLKSKWSTYQLT